MNCVAVEETKLLRATLDCQTLMVKTYRFNGCKDGSGLSIIKRCFAFLTPHSKKQVLQALVWSYLDYCPVVWSSAARKDLAKLQLAQNRVAPLALHCNQRADINTMYVSLSWLRVEERLTASLLLITLCWKSQIVCLVNLNTALTHTHLCHQGSFHSPQNQNKFKKAYSII